jgi:5-formyltetrahydrofolate cyclo-ligase
MIMACASFGSELQTDEFLRHVQDQGKILLLPRVNRLRELLEVYWVQDSVEDEKRSGSSDGRWSPHGGL